MSINYKQAQFELFPGAVSSADKAGRSAFSFSSVTLSLENLIIVGIFFVMSVIFSFSFGVYRGMKVGTIVRADNRTLSSGQPAVREAVVPATKSQGNPNIPLQPLSGNNSVISKKETSPQAIASINLSLAAAQKNIASIKNPYTIQVASYKTKESAQREAVVLKNKGYDIFIAPKGNYVILCVGKFAGKDEANTFLSKLKKSYKDCLIRRL